MEIVEFPLIKSKKNFEIEKKNSLSSYDAKMIAENCLERIIFIKDVNGKIKIREISYIPDIEYLRNSQFDISKNQISNIDPNFSGAISVQKWNGYKLVRNILKNGKVTSRSVKSNIKKSKLSNRPAGTQCNGVLVTEYQCDCDIRTTIKDGDIMITVDCSEWYETGNQWCIPYEDIPESSECVDPSSQACFCELIGGCENEEGFEQECQKDCEQAAAELASFTFETIDIKDVTEGASENPDQNGNVKKPFTLNWKFYKANFGILSPSVEWAATFYGIKYKHVDSSLWRFESFVYDKTRKASGHLPLCISADMQTTVAPIVIFADNFRAEVNLTFSLTVTVPCFFGSEIDTEQGTLFNFFSAN